MAESGNLFDSVSSSARSEQFLELLARPGLRIERIVSTGQASPPGYWYDQPRGEWIVVLEGEAKIRFEDEPAPRLLGRGDFLNIPARRRHRVEWTHPAAATIWLAIHYDE